MKSIILTSVLFFAQNLVWGSDQPNIIVILTDDQGYHDVGFNGCKDIPTPNIDRLAKNGVVFPNGYVSYSVCGPSRAGLLTGRYQGRFGFSSNPTLDPGAEDAGLPLDEDMISEVLGRAGYHSMIVGKWHMGSHPFYHPLRRGFNEFFGFLVGGHRYFPEEWVLWDLSEVKQRGDWYRTKLMRNFERVEEAEYLTDALSREAVDYIYRRAKERAPFFLYLAYNAPHGPLQASEKYLDRFNHMEAGKRKTYAAMVSSIDDGVGGVLDALEQNGISDNTLVFYLSDNGGARGNASNNEPLRGFKGSMLEGGLRVPFAMQYPGKIKGGQVFEHPVISLDILGTMAGLTGAVIDPLKPLDGVNLVPYLMGMRQGAPHEYLFWYHGDGDAYAVRSGDLKLTMEGKGGEPALYNLASDMHEDLDLSRSKAEEKAVLQQAWDEWMQDMKFSTYRTLSNDVWWE